MLTTADAANLTQYVEQGGTLLVSFFSAIVDEFDTVHDGGFLSPLRVSLGVTVEEFLPLRENVTVTVTWNGAVLDAEVLNADVWQEHLALAGAEVMATYLDGPGAGMPAITRNTHGTGVGWYVSTRLDAAGLAEVMTAVYTDAGIVRPEVPAGVEVVTRRGAEADYVIAINHGEAAESVAVSGFELIGQRDTGPRTELAAGAVAVVRTPK